MCGKHKRGKGPAKIGMIIVSQVTMCAACEKFERCYEPPAILARTALELAARRAVEDARRRQSCMN